jgi:hypothetical protein
MLGYESIVAAYGKGRFAGVSSLMMLPANFIRGPLPEIKAYEIIWTPVKKWIKARGPDDRLKKLQI